MALRTERDAAATDTATGAATNTGTPPERILAEATNLRAARMREALELARQRRAEVATIRAQRDEAIQQRDAARETLDGLRRRRAVRLALRAVRAADRLIHRRGSSEAARRDAGRKTATAARAGAADRATPASPATPGDPASYREALVARLRASGAGTGADPIRAVVLESGEGSGDSSAGVATGLSGLGWEMVAAGTTDDAADIAIVAAPDVDPRRLARDVITVAVIRGSVDEWTGTDWFDGFDIVVVRDDATATAVTKRSAKTATVIDTGTGAWPPAGGIRDAVVAWASATRMAIMVQALRWDVAEPSGDYHLARGLQRQFERRGHPTSVYFQRQWTAAATAREDVVIHLWGRYELDPRPTQINALWILYHPELVTDELCRRYDRVFAASDALAARLSARTGVDVRSLHQATDPERFKPTDGPDHELLFVGNSRGTRRTIIDDVSPSRHDLAVYGGGWEPELVDPAAVRGKVVANRDLPGYYANAGIVLNDHWLESVEAGLINNRLYDALAAGAFVISDTVPGLDGEFDGGVMTYTDPADLALKVDRFLADPELRRPYVERGRAAVLARHTLEHRADELLASLLPLVEGRRERPR
ncbi:MAG TPA: glycosyltransferase [Candidatus Limnocylindrales bacterium]